MAEYSLLVIFSFDLIYSFPEKSGLSKSQFKQYARLLFSSVLYRDTNNRSSITESTHPRYFVPSKYGIFPLQFKFLLSSDLKTFDDSFPSTTVNGIVNAKMDIDESTMLSLFIFILHYN